MNENEFESIDILIIIDIYSQSEFFSFFLEDMRVFINAIEQVFKSISLFAFSLIIILQVFIYMKIIFK